MARREGRTALILYRALQVAHVLIAVYITAQGGSWLLMGPVSLLFLLVPLAVWLLLRVRLTAALSALILLLCTLSYSLGTVIRVYDMLPGFDKGLHFASGTLFTVLGACLYATVAGEGGLGGRRLWVRLLFGVGFSMFVAVFWEILEYLAFLITGHDAQYVAQTGVGDTMGDLIVCVLGSALALLDGLWRQVRGRSPLTWLVDGFDALNAPGGAVES